MPLHPTQHLAAAIAVVAVVATACADEAPPGGYVRRLPPPAPLDRPALVTSGQPSVERPRAPVRVHQAAWTDVVPARATASMAAADTAFRHRRYGEAASLFDRYLLDDPDRRQARFMAGLAHLRAGRPDLAETRFRRVLADTPDDVSSLQQLARALLEQGRFRDAREVVDVALDIDRTAHVSHRLAARTLVALGEMDAARDAYEHALSLRPADAWTLNNLGVLELRLGRLEAAVTWLAEAVRQADGVALFHNNLGIALERSGQRVEASEAFRSALIIEPGSARAAENLERIQQASIGSGEAGRAAR